MQKDINAKYPGRNLGREFNEALAVRQRYKKATRKENIVLRQSISSPRSQSYLRKTYNGNNKGYEDRYYANGKIAKSNVFTSWLDDSSRLRDIDRVWLTIERIKKRNPHEKPFYLFPINRTDRVVENTEKAAMVCREASKDWPICQRCGDALYWGIVPTETEEEARIYVRDRMLFCDNPACALCGIDIGLRASNVTFSDAHITHLFRKPFLDDIARRARDIKRGIKRTPKIFMRALQLKGGQKKKKISTVKVSDYDDLVGQDRPDLFIDKFPED
jgi:hypothetical protein